MEDFTIWFIFSFGIIIALSIDTFLVNNRNIGPNRSVKAALIWSAIWISLALFFNCILWFYLYQNTNPAMAHYKALTFLTGYLIEKSLSIDNLFVFFLIFHQLQIPTQYQHRIFTIGIWTAIILRLVIILLGTWLVTKFHWILYLMGIFLIYTGLRILFVRDKHKEFQHTYLYKTIQLLLRTTHEVVGNKFYFKKNNVTYFTPLFIALIFIEISDIIFAFDSIPAIFAITTDPFIVWTSNIFAILGLRALYFVLAHMVERFSLLKYGISVILMFVGFKMVIEPWYRISILFSLGIIFGVLVSFILVSIYTTKSEHHARN